MVSEDQAGAQLTRLIDRALRGEDVIITRHDRPVLQLVRVENPTTDIKPPARFGSGKGTLLYMAPDFNAPLEDFGESRWVENPRLRLQNPPG
jgi:antitoxin (DNA-binding transcriptional repressor) of toxin-antitoxin stability system